MEMGDWKTRLAESAEAGVKKMTKYRRARNKLVREYLGDDFADMPMFTGSSGGRIARKKRGRPYNVLHQGVWNAIPNVIAGNPYVKVHAKRFGLKPTALLLEEALTHLNKEDDFAWTVRQGVRDAMFGAGVFVTGMDNSGYGIEDKGVFYDIGQPYTCCVSIDDFVIDPTARSLEECRWMSHRYRVSMERLRMYSVFPPEFVDAMSRYDTTKDKSERTSEIANQDVNPHDADRFTEWAYLYQFWMPQEGLTVFMPCGHDGMPGAPERAFETEYFGPEAGPYDVLGFDWVPETAMPIPPIASWLDMHTAVNTIAAKLVESSAAMKNIVAGDLEAEEDLKAIRDAENNSVIKVKNIDRIKPITVGGASDRMLESFETLVRASSSLQGTAEMVGNNAKTATEAELVASSASSRLTDMQASVERCVKKITEKRAWYLWPGHNPVMQLPMVKEIAPGVNFPLVLSPEVVEGDYLDFNFDIEAGSMLKMSPQVRLRRKLEHAQFMLQAAQMQMATGGMFNATEAIAITGKDIWDPGELDRVWNDQGSQMAQMQLGGIYNPSPAQAGGGGAPAPGRPGSPGMPGGTKTGSSSPNFDRTKNTENTMDTVTQVLY